MSATLSEIVIAVRELAFDRYPIPAIILKNITGKFLTNNATHFKILATAGGTVEYTYTYAPDGATDTLQALTDDLLTNNRVFSYTGYYSSFDKLDELLLYTDKPFGTLPITMFRRYFMSDAKIIELILQYYKSVLGLEDTTTSVTLPTDVALLDSTTIHHLTLWVALNLVDARRLSEQAAMAFQMNWSDGTGPVAGANLNTPGQSVTVNIGSAFSLTDDNSVNSNYFSADFNRIGSDNVLGDKEGWWFKLWLSLRARLERTFNDFSFRDNNAMQSTMTLQKDLNYLAYYESYPYTHPYRLSSLARNILS
jgi:hypothetical protein